MLSYFVITIISGLSKEIVDRQITLIVGRKILWKLAPSVNRNASNDRKKSQHSSDCIGSGCPGRDDEAVRTDELLITSQRRERKPHLPLGNIAGIVAES